MAILNSPIDFLFSSKPGKVLTRISLLASYNNGQLNDDQLELQLLHQLRPVPILVIELQEPKPCTWKIGSITYHGILAEAEIPTRYVSAVCEQLLFVGFKSAEVKDVSCLC